VVYRQDHVLHLDGPPVGVPLYCRASQIFWNIGSALQKSQGGLLRSLLHDILSEHEDRYGRAISDLQVLRLTQKSRITRQAT
jgi:hypothetical protein